MFKRLKIAVLIVLVLSLCKIRAELLAILRAAIARDSGENEAFMAIFENEARLS